MLHVLELKYVGSDVSTADDSTSPRNSVARGPSQRMRAGPKSVSKEMSRGEDERAIVDPLLTMDDAPQAQR